MLFLLPATESLTVTGVLDKALRPSLITPVKSLPRGIVVDFHTVRVIDITALLAFENAIEETKRRGSSVILINIHPSVLPKLKKYEIKNFVFSDSKPDFEIFLKLSALDTEEDVKSDDLSQVDGISTA